MSGTQVIGGGVYDDDSPPVITSDGFDMLRWGWASGVLAGSPSWSLPGDDTRCSDAHDLYFGRAEGWAWA